MSSAVSPLQSNGVSPASPNDMNHIENVIKVKSEGDQRVAPNHFVKLRVAGNSSTSLSSLNDGRSHQTDEKKQDSEKPCDLEENQDSKNDQCSSEENELAHGYKQTHENKKDFEKPCTLENNQESKADHYYSKENGLKGDIVSTAQEVSKENTNFTTNKDRDNEKETKGKAPQNTERLRKKKTEKYKEETEKETPLNTSQVQSESSDDAEGKPTSKDISVNKNSKQSSCKIESSDELSQKSDEDNLSDIKDLNSVSPEVDRQTEGQRRGSLIRRNIGSFRRMFKKHHSRSHSESPITERKPETNQEEELSRKTQSETNTEVPTSPVSIGADEVFGQEEQIHSSKISRAHSDTDAGARPKPKLRHTHTLPSLFAYARRASVSKEAKSPEDDDTKDSGQTKRKFGSFGFSRQLPDCKEDKDDFGNAPKGESKNFDTVYKVLKEGIDLRYKEFSPGPEENAEQAETKLPCFPIKSILRKKPVLKHQLSEPTPGSSTPFQEVRRAVSSEDTICSDSPEREFSSTANGLPAVPGERSPDTNPVLDVNQNNPPKETESTLSKEQIKEIERLTEEGSMYVALYKYDAREREDLSLRMGDRVRVIDDSNDTWWMGECDNKTGFIPCNYVMQLRPKEKVYICVRATLLQDFSKKEVQLKKNQVVAVSFSRPVKDSHYVLTRCPNTEGYVHKENLKPL